MHIHLIHYSKIVVAERQRREINPKSIVELKRSILDKGLLHPPVITLERRLVAGERRLRAMVELHEDGQPFDCNGCRVAQGLIPYLILSELTPIQLMEAELEENILRAQLTWLEECEAKAKIHEAKKSFNPRQTLRATAEEIAVKQGESTEEIAKTLSAKTKDLQTSLLINAHKDEPEVRAAKHSRQAEKLILDKLEAKMRRQLIELVPSSQPSRHTLIHGDCKEKMEFISPDTFDIIFTDPPYGINADTQKNDSQHFYDDSAGTALSLCEYIIRRGFIVTKTKATLFMFCDIDHFHHLRDYAQQQCWVPWRVPIIFHKGVIGHAPWGRAGFIRSYECALYAVKGQKELYAPGGADVKLYTNYGINQKRERTHAAEKPVPILKHMLSIMGLPGHTVLDPCCGAGGIFPAAEANMLAATGIELSEHFYNVALSRISTLAETTNDESNKSADVVEEVDTTGLNPVG